MLQVQTLRGLITWIYAECLYKPKEKGVLGFSRPYLGDEKFYDSSLYVIMAFWGLYEIVST